MKSIKALLSNWFLCSILTLVILWALFAEFLPLQLLEYKVYDFMAGLRQQDAENPLVIVAIDNKSLKTIGNWPWPRSYIADMVKVLSKNGVSALGIHLLYSNKELNPGLKEVETLRNIIQDELHLKDRKKQDKINKILLESEKKLNHDIRLISAVRSAINVVLPIRFLIDSGGEVDIQKISSWLRINSLDLTSDKVNLKKASIKFGNIQNFFQKDEILVAKAVEAPFPELSTKAGGLGHINLIEDKDGLVRKVPLFIRYQERYFPSFSLQVASKYLKENLRNIKPGIKEFGFTGLRTNKLDIPTDQYFRMLIDFKSNGSGFQTFSFSDVLAGNVPADAFLNKIVLLGVTAEGITSVYKTSANRKIPEVMVAAHIVENIVNHRHLLRPTWANILEALIILYFGFFLLFVIPKVNPRIGMMILGIFIMSWFGFTIIFFLINGYWFKVFAPVFLSIFGYALVIYKTFSKKREQENVELKKMVGLSFQGKGMLDMAYERFLKCPIEDQSVKELFYNLGLDFERKRMFNKALAVYTHMLKAGKFKDIKERIKKLKSIEEKIVLSADTASQDKTLLLENATTTPTLGRYEILKELGQGAMGTVYLGRDPAINREVAIKTIRYMDVDQDRLSAIKKRLFREAEAAGKLSHPNIITVFDVGEDYDMAYIAMELINGNELTDHCRKGRLLSIKRILKVIYSVADALAYAHSQGVVHRDIKPANILLLKNGEIKVADFGIAKLMSSPKNQTEVIYGTPSYMSPEQISGQKVDGRSDLFSLGIVFYELLTGEKPFKADNINNLMYAITSVNYVPLSKMKPDAPPFCIRIVDKLLTKSPAQRIQSADKLMKQIRLGLKKTG